MTIQPICVHPRSSAVNTSRSQIVISFRDFLLSSGENHREHRGHREKQQISVLSVSSVVDYPCSTSIINVNAIARGLNNFKIIIYTKVNKNDNYSALKYVQEISTHQ